MKTTVVASLAYKRPGQVKGLRDLLKYLQYRDGSLRRESFLRDGRYPDQPDALTTSRSTSWIDRGMGEGYRGIVRRAHELRGRAVLARTWVISPDPELMRHVPADQRQALVARLTESTLERWYGDNGWGQPEYSYVIHDKQRRADGMQMLHAHVITPGTIPVDSAGELGRVDHYVSRAHIRDLHAATGQLFEQELGRILGREQALRLIRARESRQQQRGKPLRALGNLMQLIEMEQAARNRGKDAKKVRRMAAELRAASRYFREERRQRQQADRERLQSAQLETDRQRHRAKIAHIQEAGQPVQTPAELQAAEDRERAALGAYYLSLLTGPNTLARDADERYPDREELEL